MTTRMISPDGGATHAYGEGDIARLEKLGWVVEKPVTAPVINGDTSHPTPAEVIEERYSIPVLPGEDVSTPLTASVGVHSVIDQSAIAEVLQKRKPGRPPKAK